jgi:hypothetical protein
MDLVTRTCLGIVFEKLPVLRYPKQFVFYCLAPIDTQTDMQQNCCAQVLGRICSCLWALAVMRQWRHPLMGLLLEHVSRLDRLHTQNLAPVHLCEVTQFMLLAAAENLIQIILEVPEHLRDRCITTWKGISSLNPSSLFRLMFVTPSSPFLGILRVARESSTLF